MNTNIISKLFEDYLDIQRHWMHYLVKQDKENLLSFLKGYSIGRGNDFLTDYLSLYLYYNYHIDMNYNNWQEQIDHYAYIKKNNWFDSFYLLLNEILENKQNLGVPKTKSTYKPEPHTLAEKQQDVVNLPNGLVLKVGDFIQLNDKIGEGYKQTKFYDASLRNPSWDLFYPSEKDFKHIYFYLPEENEMGVSIFGRVRRIFSNSIAKIKSIRINNHEIIAYTDGFKIDVVKAIEQEEFKILNAWTDNITLVDLSSLKEQFFNYTMGLTLSLTEEINKWCFYNLHDLNKEWHKYRFSMGRQWDKVEKD